MSRPFIPSHWHYYIITKQDSNVHSLRHRPRGHQDNLSAQQPASHTSGYSNVKALRQQTRQFIPLHRRYYIITKQHSNLHSLRHRPTGHQDNLSAQQTNAHYFNLELKCWNTITSPCSFNSSNNDFSGSQCDHYQLHWSLCLMFACHTPSRMLSLSLFLSLTAGLSSETSSQLPQHSLFICDKEEPC